MYVGWGGEDRLAFLPAASVYHQVFAPDAPRRNREANLGPQEGGRPTTGDGWFCGKPSLCLCIRGVFIRLDIYISIDWWLGSTGGLSEASFLEG